MRPDQRLPDELRPVVIERGYTKHAPGSVRISFGDTIVLCTAIFEDRVPRWIKDSGRGWVTAEYAMLPSASAERVGRDAAKGGRAQEISRLIGRSLRAVTDLEAIGACQITIDCDVLQADGGTRTAAITGAFVALHDALASSVAAGNLPAIPLKGICAAVSVGVVHGTPLLDLCYKEDVAADVDMNLVMNESGDFIEIQGSAEGALFSRERVNQMLDIGTAGIGKLIRMQKEALEIA